MTDIAPINVREPALDALHQQEGDIAAFVDAKGALSLPVRRLNRFMRGMIAAYVNSDDFKDAKQGAVKSFDAPVNLAAKNVHLIKLERRAKIEDAQRAGSALAKAVKKGALTVLCGAHKRQEDMAEALLLRHYHYQAQKTAPKDMSLSVTFWSTQKEQLEAALREKNAIAQGVFFTRDLVNAPANVLTTKQFAAEISALANLGLEIEILEESALEKLGMRLLLSVGQGAESPSKVAVMRWKGGGDEAPFALVGKGVVFDTGGISLKPAGGMEDMTMDMGGAGVVAGVMKTLALRGAKANVVGLVGLVENMPSGAATRPGDVVKSMKGDTVEIINTDAEGRLVLADVLWYAQEKYKPCGMINLATLTGAIIIGLGHEMAGVFSNNDELSQNFIEAARAQGEGAWPMPLAPAYDKQLESRIADIKNVGGRAAGSITAGQFLKRFVKEDMPWAHLDIAGVASVKTETRFAPAGATGWGVRALNAYIAKHHER